VVHAGRTRELDPATLYAILRLRAEVFVVEQHCAYLDPDGRDLEPDCILLWIEGDAEPDVVLATARVLTEHDGRRRIGRVCTSAAARTRGLAAELMGAALERCGDGRVVLDAQSQLVDWYARFGFEPTGRDFVEDGIPHTEMARR